MSQAQQIQQAVLRSLHSRDLYTERQVNSMLKALRNAEIHIKSQLVEIGEKKLLKKGLEVRREQVRGIQKGIDVIISDLKSDQTVVMRTAVRESFQNGITGSIGEFSQLRFPYYVDLSHEARVKLAGQVMSLIDRSALDFLVNYNLQLLGNVTRELADSIKQQISIGIITGDSIAKIGEKIGGVITDPDKFRRAGKTVFRTAQNRVEVITRTETLRAYGQGRRKFYDTVGVKRVVWVTADDERTCPECGPLDGKEFPIDQAPPIPKHPRCRCCVTAIVMCCGRRERLPAWEAHENDGT
ncbi:MAG: minor capsid protein [Candidatus Hatepunaea meridiana]|nr:minor capsid protein [Candidatus Hatepunaea meridiana]